VCTVKGICFSVKNMNLNRNVYTVNRIIPPINKEAFHYETADYRISGLFVLFLLLGIFSSNALAIQYKVKNGDTLSSISKKFGVSVDQNKASKQPQAIQNSKKPKF